MSTQELSTMETEALESALLEWHRKNWQEDEYDELQGLLAALQNDAVQHQQSSETRDQVTTAVSGSGGDGSGHDSITNLKDLALFVLDHIDSTDKLKNYFVRHTMASGCDGMIYWQQGDETKKVLRQKVSDLTEPDIIQVRLNDACSEREKFDAKEAYLKFRKELFPNEAVKNELLRLFLDDCGREYPYVEGIVDPPMSQRNVAFSVDYSKGAALVVTGESGAGKSWYAKYHLPKMFWNASFIYCVLKDAASLPRYEPKDKALSEACSDALKLLQATGNSTLLDVLSEVSRRNNCKRNAAATDHLDGLVRARLGMKSAATQWWDHFVDENCGETETLEELVIVIDEVGKDPELARGLVDEVRVIYSTIRARKMAKKVLLVLVGSGLERFIQSVGIETDDDEFNAEYSSFGTDPTKSNVVELSGPGVTISNKLRRIQDLKPEEVNELHDLCGIPWTSIFEGTYSRVLATNTRMLFRGVVPIFKSHLNTARLEGNDLHDRRVLLGSTNHVMDACARMYVELNGLSSCADNDQEKKLQNQFRVLFNVEITSVKKAFSLDHEQPLLWNPAYEDQTMTFTNKEYIYLLKSGLITSDVISTSKALRYLACNGQTAQLVAENGISFEEILQHHLARLSKVQWEHQAEGNANSPDNKKREYTNRMHSLVQAWPPSSTKGDSQLPDEDSVSTEVKSRFESESQKERGGDDVASIAGKVQGCTDFDVVIRQTAGNVQGADVMVLRRRDGGDAYLDLYQAKHYASAPTRGSKKIKEAFSSLGVRYGINNSEELDITPKIGSAGYSYKGTNQFIDALNAKLSFDVKFGNRIVAFSCTWKSFSKSKTWKEFPFQQAQEQGVFLWGSEMIEPTISALKIRGKAETQDDEKYDDKSDKRQDEAPPPKKPKLGQNTPVAQIPGKT